MPSRPGAAGATKSNAPSSRKTCVNDVPGASGPERHSPSRATTVCSVSVSFVQVIAVPGRTTRRDGVNPVSLMLILLVKTVRGSMGCGLAGGSAPSSAKTHRVSPRGKLSCQLPPEATAIYCFPLIA